MDKINAESGFQLMCRFNSRTSLLHLDDVLFPDGPRPGDIIQISGESTVGKSFLLMKFLAKALLPKTYNGVELGGLGASVILIDTDNGISILKLVCLMEKTILSSYDMNTEKKISTNVEAVEKIIRNSLKNMLVLKTHTSFQLEMNSYSIEKLLTTNANISLIIIDSLTSYYWSDLAEYKPIKKMDLYLKIQIEKFLKYSKEYETTIIFTTQEYFQSKQNDFSSFLIKYKIDLKKNEELEKFTACINEMNSYQYSLSENGFTWVLYSSCGYASKFEELSTAIKAVHPDVEINSKNGSPGSFEVTINGELVHSKLQTLAFPDFESVVEMVKEVKTGMAPRKIANHQPIVNCIVS